MNPKMTGGLLTAALALSVLCSTAQQSPTHSGSYSMNTKGRPWVTYNEQQARIDRMQEELDAMQRKLDKEMIRSLISDLVAEKILADEDQCKWLALTADRLIVNGKTQSKALHRKFKKKYIRKAGFGIFYGNPPKQGGEPEPDSEE